MSKMCVADMCHEGGTVAATLVVVKAEMRAFSSKPGQFLWLTLRDATGEIEAKMWQPPVELRGALDAGTPVAIEGRISRWRDKFDLVLELCQPLSPDTIDPSDFLPACPSSLDELWDEFRRHISHVQDRHYHALLDVLCADDELITAFRRAPASRSWHHGYLGGLLEHTVGVLRVCDDVANRRHDVDRCLLLTGAIFHDLGKVDDYRYDTVIDRSPSGRFLGHIVTGYQRLCELASRVEGFPRQKLLQLGHIIVAHHGKAEWGSPQKPKTIEAQIVHFADNLDAQVNGFGLVLADGRAHEVEWTSYHRLLGTEVYAAVADDEEHS